MIDYLYIIDEALTSMQSDIDDIKDFFSESYVTIDIPSLIYYDILKKLKFNLGYECDGLEIKVRALRDKLNDQT